MNRPLENVLRLFPLGGLGEVGMNCMVLESAGKLVAIDCGLTFPDREPGVELIHPDFEALLARQRDLLAVVLTHGHEDHVGAVPFLLRDLDRELPVYGPPYTLEVLKKRLEEVEVPHPPRLIETKPRQRFELGPFGFVPFRVTHSMPDCTGLVIETSAGTVVHTGDFKLDPNPPDGEGSDEELLREMGERGVRLLLSDSTNAEVKGSAGAERSVEPALQTRIAAATGRVVVCLFGSNVHRVSAVLRAAAAANRRVLLLGRSLQTHAAIAQTLGLLPDRPATFVRDDEAQSVPRAELLVIATGSQGEPAAALSRLAARTHHRLTLDPGDEVILSSRIIPGRERQVVAMVDKLERGGVRVFSRQDDPTLHVSGHAGRDEQARMIELTRPRAFIPIHGSYVHLARHAALAISLGVKETLVVENGAVVRIDAEGVRVEGSVEAGRVHLQAGEEIGSDVLRERERLSSGGVVLVHLRMDGTGRLAEALQISARGVVDEETLAELGIVQRTRTEVARALKELGKRPSREALEQAVVRAARKVFRDALGFRPVVHAVVDVVDR